MSTNLNFGKPWNVVATYDSFDAADTRRKKELAEGINECKVHHKSVGFVVKVRPSAQPEAVVDSKIEEKTKKIRSASPKRDSRKAAKVKAEKK